MNVTFGSGNRIVVPKQIRDEMCLETGEVLNMYIDNGNIIISRTEQNSNTINILHQFPKIQTKNEQQILEKLPQNVKNIKIIDGVKIVSNLEEGEKFSKKYYSPCKLVIRTKNAYLKKFCEACKGTLLDEYGENYNCPYKQNSIKETKVTDIVNNLKDNVKVLDTIIDNKTEKLRKEQELQKLLKEGKKSIVPISSPRGHLKCHHCGEFLQKGFLVDNTFYCKNCTVENFKKYFKKYKKLKEEI